jgi:hypothetical protein
LEELLVGNCEGLVERALELRDENLKVFLEDFSLF